MESENSPWRIIRKIFYQTGPVSYAIFQNRNLIRPSFHEFSLAGKSFYRSRFHNNPQLAFFGQVPGILDHHTPGQEAKN